MFESNQSFCGVFSIVYEMYARLHLWNPIEKPGKTLRASVLRTKKTAPEKKLADRGSDAWGSRKMRVHTGTLLYQRK